MKVTNRFSSVSIQAHFSIFISLAKLKAFYMKAVFYFVSVMLLLIGVWSVYTGAQEYTKFFTEGFFGLHKLAVGFMLIFIARMFQAEAHQH